jgi:hypothetical protein
MLAVDREARDLLRRAVAAIPWSRLQDLRALALMGDNATPVDLGFLAQLPQLTTLDLRDVRHAGRRPSPLEPPFGGLPTGLRAGLIEVPEPDRIRDELMRHRDAVPSFRDLLTYDEGRDWEIDALEGDDGWATYGSLYLAADGQDGETEYDALAAAKRRLRAADPALLRTLDFDPEAAGTGISAPTREQLERALRILGLG